MYSNQAKNENSVKIVSAKIGERIAAIVYQRNVAAMILHRNLSKGVK
jgi:hypothetical protein